MAKFQNEMLAGQPVVFAYVGTIELDAEGFFEVDNEQLISELKKVKGFKFIPEAPKPVEQPKEESKEEPKQEEPKTPKAATKSKKADAAAEK